MPEGQVPAAERLAKEKSDLLARAKSIAESAQQAGRGLTAAEQAEAESALERVKQIERWQVEAKAADAVMQRLGSRAAPAPVGGERFGLVGYDAEGIKAGLVNAVRSKQSYGFTMPFVKAALTVGGVDLPSSGTFGSGEPLGTAAVALRDLFTPQEAAGPTVRYYTIGAGNADVVAEGGLKPDLGATITPTDAELVKIATTFGFTDEMADDAEFLLGFVQREALRAVLVEENTQIITALSGATGTVTDSGALTEAIDVLGRVIGTSEATNGVTPSAILLNPSDLATIRATKASTSGTYVLDPMTSGPTAIHGVPVLSTPAVTAGTAYVTSPGFGVFYTRGALRVETGYTGDDWIYNRVTTRVEERVLPVVVRPSLLAQVTLTTAP